MQGTSGEFTVARAPSFDVCAVVSHGCTHLSHLNAAPKQARRHTIAPTHLLHCPCSDHRISSLKRSADHYEDTLVRLARAITASDSVLQGFRHRVGPRSLDLGRYLLWYCSVSVWEPRGSCVVIYVRGVRLGSAKKVLSPVLHACIGGGCVADIQRAHIGGERVDACAWRGYAIWGGGGCGAATKQLRTWCTRTLRE